MTQYIFALQLAAEKNIKFYETSAQSNINIDEVRHIAAINSLNYQ